MAVYALIRKGTIVNRAVFADGVPESWPDRGDWHLADDKMQMGATLVDGTWKQPMRPDPSPPEPEPQDSIAAIRADLDALAARLNRLAPPAIGKR